MSYDLGTPYQFRFPALALLLRAGESRPSKVTRVSGSQIQSRLCITSLIIHVCQCLAQSMSRTAEANQRHKSLQCFQHQPMSNSPRELACSCVVQFEWGRTRIKNASHYPPLQPSHRSNQVSNGPKQKWLKFTVLEDSFSGTRCRRIGCASEGWAQRTCWCTRSSRLRKTWVSLADVPSKLP
jgi:hypothetical protein